MIYIKTLTRVATSKGVPVGTILHWEASRSRSGGKVAQPARPAKFERTLILWNVLMKIKPFPHISIHFDNYLQYTQKSEHLKENTLSAHFMNWVHSHPFSVYTLAHNFSVSNPPFHTKIWTSWLVHFSLSRPPSGWLPDPRDRTRMLHTKCHIYELGA